MSEKGLQARPGHWIHRLSTGISPIPEIFGTPIASLCKKEINTSNSQNNHEESKSRNGIKWHSLCINELKWRIITFYLRILKRDTYAINILLKIL